MMSFIRIVASFAIISISLLGSVSGEEAIFDELATTKMEFQAWDGLINRGDGYFYGATRWHEQLKGGLVYQMGPGENVRIFHKFPEIAAMGEINYDGSNPCCGLRLGPDGAFYGATSAGGAYGRGTIYRISPDGVFSVIHDMGQGDGYDVHSLLIDFNGDIYGTVGGGEHGSGAIFRIGADRDLKIVYSFPAPNYPPFGTYVEGLVLKLFNPKHLVRGRDGKIYGTASSGGPLEPSPWRRFSYGGLFRFDGPGEIAEITHFSESMRSAWITPMDDGFLAASGVNLARIDFNGTLSILADFNSISTGMGLTKLIQTPAGYFGASLDGGSNHGGFVYKYTPQSGTEVIYDFPVEYKGKLRELVAGNDGMVYGLAAFTDDAKSGSTGSRLFRLQTGSGVSANLEPLVKTDVDYLPKEIANGRREAIIDILANDKDPDGDSLNVAGLTGTYLVIGGGTHRTGGAQMISTPDGPRLRFWTSDPDPASQLIFYWLTDGNGGLSKGYSVVRSSAKGTYSGVADHITNEDAPSALLAIKVDEKNGISASLSVSGKVFAGKSTLDVDETADIALDCKGSPSQALHLSLQRGTPRVITARIFDGDSMYTGTCTQVLHGD